MFSILLSAGSRAGAVKTIFSTSSGLQQICATKAQSVTTNDFIPEPLPGGMVVRAVLCRCHCSCRL